jgi:hypothetical protein
MQVIHITSYNLPRLSKSVRQNPHFDHYENKNQAKMSGCCYRSIDITAIDFENVECGAQHEVFESESILIIISTDLMHIKKEGIDCMLHTLRGAGISLYLSPFA